MGNIMIKTLETVNYVIILVILVLTKQLIAVNVALVIILYVRILILVLKILKVIIKMEIAIVNVQRNAKLAKLGKQKIVIIVKHVLLITLIW